jgi:hypothetical protein
VGKPCKKPFVHGLIPMQKKIGVDLYSISIAAGWHKNNPDDLGFAYFAIYNEGTQVAQLELSEVRFYDSKDFQQFIKIICNKAFQMRYERKTLLLHVIDGKGEVFLSSPNRSQQKIKFNDLLFRRDINLC